MSAYRLSEQNCKKCSIVDRCDGLDDKFNDVTREYKNTGDVVVVQVINCDDFDKK